jgi:hypothetical protein
MLAMAPVVPATVGIRSVILVGRIVVISTMVIIVFVRSIRIVRVVIASVRSRPHPHAKAVIRFRFGRSKSDSYYYQGRQKIILHSYRFIWYWTEMRLNPFDGEGPPEAFIACPSDTLNYADAALHSAGKLWARQKLNGLQKRSREERK